LEAKEVQVEGKQLSPVRDDPSEQVAHPEALESTPEALALADVTRAVRDDCRVDPEKYLEEVRMLAAGE
jgi:hypothetical protein